MEPRLPRGMRDILPEQMMLRRYVIRAFEEIFEAYGFEPLQTPALELRETLMGKYGPDAEKLIYDARHREGKEELSLRYDLSVPLARVVAMYPNLPRPFKRYQIAPVWRAERPQKGRYREFYQCDADIVGTSSMAADAEIISLIHEALTRLGFRNFVILLNDRKLLTGLGRYSGVPEPLLGSLYRAIDKFDRLGLEGVQEEMRRYGIPEEAIARMLELLRIEGDHAEILGELSRRMQAAEIPEGLEGIRELEALLRFVEAMGVPSERYRISFTMVRGLEYYTGPIFETVVTEPKIGSITGGGRYDGLVGLFARQSVPMTGTSFGIERIIDVIQELGMAPPDLPRTPVQVLVTVFDEPRMGASIALAQAFRRAGLKVMLYFEPRRLEAQLRYAHQKGIPFVAILGPDEEARGVVTVRDMGSGEQRTLPPEEAARWIRQSLGGKGDGR
ncbi:MAG: histidine--tRNA ligase [Thermoflexus sp.]|jgi:histidyl-tRNA synthetase|uniref:histidine--tRNA ligase n=1 Tax=Thermoflexus sp. TaxID=1969742 RepID=UPI00263287DD|nr:histidine--tRNA ligase [Thermoflexus sp.]MDT7884943.1 histidine--tRNA ligase [Thermoflexus sp.]MDT7946933.1 histidine--tRNA ligase [Thermoflexus sp.]